MTPPSTPVNKTSQLEISDQVPGLYVALNLLIYAWLHYSVDALTNTVKEGLWRSEIIPSQITFPGSTLTTGCNRKWESVLAA